MAELSEDDLVEALSGVLLKDEIDGLDEDLVAYLAGLLETQLVEDPSQCQDILDESMVPFLESVACPSNLIDDAKTSVTELVDSKTVSAAAPSSTGAKKLQQGLVSMQSTLSQQSDEEANRYAWGKDEGVKANANTLIDAYSDKTSAKDKRKQKQELEKKRRELAAQMQHEDNATKAGVSTMLLPTVMSKEKDVQLTGVSISLDNGRTLLESSDLKFSYQRRYGIVGENGIGKSVMLSRIANWQDLEGFPRHLRVLHVRQELHTENEAMSVLDAVLEADIERKTLLEEEQKLVARLEGNENSTSDDLLSIEERRKKIAEAKATDESFADDMKKLNEVYERLQLLRADTAQSRAAMILSGLQFTPEMQSSPIKSLSGGWRMRVALAAALLIEPDLLMLDEPTNHLGKYHTRPKYTQSFSLLKHFVHSIP